ncbi:16S rRNA (guanine(966)-N(2))-methyltransferase RsmD [Geomicrobium halophilum]|uniref:16S rRNA (Guanine(966)-N(2))-methyltransferase RsmD n=1 Tax=Geomicrobium halophilum TaxID=549000 RepID=A0A841PYS7_9BACL|nr:16S rRNA (guanine(966)-N(2))-methyltransferase RsmD [Geomicrobium halophilum]MBB6449405.1 16S rRNA (guanine(966)-N(2))-methyltransferase RsmD [Geomicrobium halophilum]
MRKAESPLRVITGKRKGTRLKAVPGSKTRPTSDKVKEALFQKIGPYFSGGIGLDLYAGSGALGIEALSRGMEEMYFSDKSGSAIKVIKENVISCHFESQAHIYKQDAVQMLEILQQKKERLSLVLLDPPYEQQQLVRDFSLIQDFQLIEDNTILVAEHSTALVLPKEIGNVSLWQSKKYRDTQLSLFKINNKYENTERNEQE